MRSETETDLTGRKQVVSNVLATWMAQGVTVVAGFVMPRVIDRHLGQTCLGVWDFAWSLIGYFALVQIGVIGSITRFVARYRSEGNQEAVNRAVSSVTCILGVMALIVLAVLAVLHFYFLPEYAAARLGKNADQARWIVLILGSEVAVQTFFSGYGGLLTGCHRWRLFTAVQAGGYALSVIGMVVALVLGGGLPMIAFIHFCGIVAVWLLVACLAYKVCPSLKVRLSLASVAEGRKMLGFGAKSFVPQVGELLLNQTVSLLILSYLGPVALAIYSRPRNLVNSTRTLVAKMAGVLIPSAGSLQAVGRLDEVRSLTVKATRYAAYMTVPFTCVLSILGGTILSVWMGPAYSDNFLPAILSIGTSLVIIETPALSILVGLDHHGPSGRVHFLACVLTSAAVWLALGVFKCHLLGAAAFAAVPITLAYVIYMPAYTARCLGISVISYVRESMGGPVLIGILFSACLLTARWFWRANPRLALFGGCAAGGLALAPVYWIWAVPRSLKAKVVGLAGRAYRLAGVVN